VYSAPASFHANLWGVYLFLAPETDYFNDERAQFIWEVAAMTADTLERWSGYENACLTEAQTRRLYEQAQQEQDEYTRVEQMRRDLTAMIYHDLRGPLHNVGASLSGLSRVLTGNDQPVIDELLHVGTESLRRLTRMVKSLLDLERLEAGRAIMTRKATKLHTLLSDALELVYPAAREADQTLLLELDDALPSVEVDADMILRVLTNLVENAIKHTPTGGRITVRAGALDHTVRVSVTDTGPGVPRRFHQEIFDKYFRIKYANAPNGVGLGLAFCRLAVEAHGGEIWVDDQPGGGAVFTFTLPVAQQDAASVSR
jgi:signal transduction histidine kinase